MSKLQDNAIVLPDDFGGPRSNLTDAERLDALIRRDRAVCMAFWDEFSPLVRGLLRATLTDRSESHVEDVLQDVFVKVLEKLEELREPKKLRSFVVGVTMNLARNDIRRHRRTLRRVRSEDVPVRAVPAKAPDQLAVQRLSELLGELKPDSRMVIVLRYLEEMEISEIAETLDMSRSTVKRRVRKARELMIEWSRRDAILVEYVQQYGGSDE
jgi:RNA polymerase sigma-70 factor (ECF subfamily)